jgi:sialate O-acetylesterase
MVLQRAPQRGIVWGFSDPSILTTLTINDKVYTTISQTEIVNEKGESIWSVTLDPVEDEGPFDIHVSQPLTNGTLVTITLNDVLFGDVWLCSGQSNMELTVGEIFNGSEEIANAGNYPKIRVFSAARNYSSTQLEELIRIYLNWSVASPKSIGGPPMEYMSAVCWLYGRMVQKALGGRPIGLIDTSYYGVDIQTWMPSQALKACNLTT